MILIIVYDIILPLQLYISHPEALRIDLDSDVMKWFGIGSENSNFEDKY